MIIKLLIDGGDMKPGPAIAQQLGPMGINLGKVISDINKATKDFKGMKVPVELNVNEKTKDFTVHTSSPPTSELIKKELSLEKGTADHKNVKVGNASIEDIIKIAKIKHPNMLEKNLKNAVKSVLGTCTSVGILVENKEPKELIGEVEEGKFDEFIREEKTEASSEKRQELKNYFEEVKNAQEKRAAEAVKAEEAKKVETEATAQPTAAAVKTEGAKPGTSSTTSAKSAAPAKKEEKKK